MFFSLSRKNKRAIEIHASRETWRTRAVKRAPKIIGDFRHRHEGVHHVLRVTRDAYISLTPYIFSPKLRRLVVFSLR